MHISDQSIEFFQTRLMQDLMLFLPELFLCLAIVLILISRLISNVDRSHLCMMALAFTIGALVVSVCQWSGVSTWEQIANPAARQPWAGNSNQQGIFSGLLIYDNFTLFMRIFLLSFTALVLVLSLLTGIPQPEESADFSCLLLGATLGMMLMASANHLLMVFIAVEMASVPSYALAGFLKTNRASSEASLKYVVYGGGAAGVMLYGISLIAGKFGTGYLPDVAKGFFVVLQNASPGAVTAFDPILFLGTLFVLVGLAFKISAVPFHFWCPDVFEGAAAEVAAFLSVASKGAALALLARFSFVLASIGDPNMQPSLVAWLETAYFLVPAIALFAAVTTTFGNLAAFAQTNMKRLLAYSTIAHAGFMLMGLATLSRDGASAVLFYLVAYLFTNLGAFAVVAFLRNQTGSEEIASYRGLIYRSPMMTVTLSIFLVSLLGIPPLAGFAAKFQVFRVLFDAGQLYTAQQQSTLGFTMYSLLVIGALNTVISAFYYLKVVRTMILDKPVEVIEGEEPEPYSTPAMDSLYAFVLSALIFVVGILWNPLIQASDAGASSFKQIPWPVATASRADIPPQ
ncbi:MAG: NADH-quinone oxidoreductase subunit N [Gemmatales bacterium]|nr:MAG: NADH-quinone oxidoreductase subunit N [Gemmatales bacterium]